jgi:hypothetical protein
MKQYCTTKGLTNGGMMNPLETLIGMDYKSRRLALNKVNMMVSKIQHAQHSVKICFAII